MKPTDSANTDTDGEQLDRDAFEELKRVYEHVKSFKPKDLSADEMAYAIIEAYDDIESERDDLEEKEEARIWNSDCNDDDHVGLMRIIGEIGLPDVASSWSLGLINEVRSALQAAGMAGR